MFQPSFFSSKPSPSAEKILTADMHNHMESLPVDLVKKLAIKHNIELPPDIFTSDGKYYNWSDFNQFLTRYDQGASFIKDLDDVTNIAYEFLKRGHIESNCIYTELTVSTIHLCKATGKSYSEVIRSVVAGIKQAEAEFDVHARINVVLVRHENGFTKNGIDTEIPVAICNTVVEEIIRNKHHYVTGIVLAGAETEFPPKLFGEIFAKAKTAGLKLSVHAGEMTDDVLDAIDLLSPDRIGHGIRAANSMEAIQTLINQGITLEICPTSNIMLNNTTQGLPELQTLHGHGVRFVLGTDDAPHFEDTTISREYQKAANALQLTQKQQLNITRHAITVSFAEEALKTHLLQRLNDHEVNMKAIVDSKKELENKRTSFCPC